MAGSIADWPRLMENIFSNLKPGGWVEFQDYNISLISEDGTLTDEHYSSKWSKLLTEACEKIGREPCPGPRLEGWVKDAGFVDIVHRWFKLPIGPWPKDPHYKDIGLINLIQLLEGLEGFTLRAFCGVHGWSKEEVLHRQSVITNFAASSIANANIIISISNPQAYEAKMAFKRKRSASELFTLFSSPTGSDSSIESFEFPVSPSPVYPRAYAAPSHLSSRTMKRFRDNRPSEDQIHQRTLNMLYSAQQQNQHFTSQTNDSDPEPAPAPAERNTQKSLHSFWTIKSAAPSIATSSAPSLDQMTLNPMSCEDCGAGLGPSDGTADGMDVDDGYSYGAGFEADHSCGACGRHVCSHCSVTNLGEQRRCLQCAGRTTWGGRGSTGQAPSSVRMF
ncbi:hypothetical protein EsH8_VII_000462 [Colletotrichum jinshuiense]